MQPNYAFIMLFWIVVALSIYRSPAWGKTALYILLAFAVTGGVTGALSLFVLGLAPEATGSVAAFFSMVAGMVAGIGHVQRLKSKLPFPAQKG
jgi:hypothetical protein